MIKVTMSPLRVNFLKVRSFSINFEFLIAFLSPLKKLYFIFLRICIENLLKSYRWNLIVTDGTPAIP